MRVILIKSIVIILIINLLIFTFISSLSEQTCISVNPSIQKTFRTLLPEGWSFFTRSPREDMVTIYKIVENKPIKINSLSSNAENFFGLSRKSRKLGYDLSIILSTFQRITWIKINSLENIKIEQQKFKKINKNQLQINTLDKGYYMIVSQPVIPWAWSKYPSRVRKQYSVCFAEII
ncbi:SdpA family antimicrobial peptide system protein [Chryseobacterium fluminis]|uniref:SdpA family antimicrobial peptide system protein n=1 Tax=Chryseobacterium fluminis TaxID=2983606 RepID=UPI0022519EA0|nr:SdpA family antimicrobial peptide system protein [Chryseobacterium sp. MMS21-Ot14]UZT99069.1 SdpA family antimicrobial peptide system protein [Chryseobacterium sp. MMS21-Ot14]